VVFVIFVFQDAEQIYPSFDTKNTKSHEVLSVTTLRNDSLAASEFDGLKSHLRGLRDLRVSRRYG